MRSILIFLGYYLFITSLGFPLSSEILRYTSRAYDVQTGKYLYQSFYKEYWKRGKHISTDITYKKAKSKKRFAEKNLNYNENTKAAPDFIFTDFRNGYFEGAQKEASNLIRLSIQKNSKVQKENESIELYDDAVVDEGFHYFIQDHWSELLEDKVLTCKFMVPSKQTYYTIKVKKEDEDDLHVRFRLYLSSFLFRFFTKELYLTYSKKSRRLSIYQGVTNIHEKGKPIYVIVRFSY